MKKLIIALLIASILSGCDQSSTSGSSGAVVENSIFNDSFSTPPLYELEHEITEVSKELALWEQGEEYLFQFDYIADDEVVLLILKDNKGAIIQQLDITTPYLLSDPDIMEDVLLHDENFIDFNFDGYIDYRCKYGEFGRTVVYAGWVWDSGDKQYHSTNLTDITNMWLEQRDQSVRGAFTGAGGSTMSIYQYRNGAFVETNRLDTAFEPFITDSETGALLTNYWMENGSKTGFQEYRLLDGEMITVWTEIISDTEEGQQRIQEHFFGKDSIWFPSER